MFSLNPHMDLKCLHPVYLNLSRFRCQHARESITACYLSSWVGGAEGCGEGAGRQEPGIERDQAAVMTRGCVFVLFK